MSFLYFGINYLMIHFLLIISTWPYFSCHFDNSSQSGSHHSPFTNIRNTWWVLNICHKCSRILWSIDRNSTPILKDSEHNALERNEFKIDEIKLCAVEIWPFWRWRRFCTSRQYTNCDLIFLSTDNASIFSFFFYF